jgi:hypothetical protein
MITEKFNKIIEDFCNCEEDTAKAVTGNVSAARRTRKALMEISKEIKSLRAMILENSKKE